MSTHNCYVHQHISSQLCYRYTRLYWRYSIASRTPRVVYGFLNNPRCLILQIFAKVEICWWGRRSRASVAALESWWSIASERIRLVKGSHSSKDWRLRSWASTTARMKKTRKGFEVFHYGWFMSIFVIFFYDFQKSLFRLVLHMFASMFCDLDIVMCESCLRLEYLGSWVIGLSLWHNRCHCYPSSQRLILEYNG